MTRRSPVIDIVPALVSALAGAPEIPRSSSVAALAASEPAFTSVQPELLGVRNSYSNAWGDYDNDGDLDLAP